MNSEDAAYIQKKAAKIVRKILLQRRLYGELL